MSAQPHSSSPSSGRPGGRENRAQGFHSTGVHRMGRVGPACESLGRSTLWAELVSGGLGVSSEAWHSQDELPSLPAVSPQASALNPTALNAIYVQTAGRCVLLAPGSSLICISNCPSWTSEMHLQVNTADRSLSPPPHTPFPITIKGTHQPPRYSGPNPRTPL